MKYWLFGISFVYLLAIAAHAQTQEQLIAGAKNEARLVLYASAATQQLQMYQAAFNKRYPFIKFEYFRTDKQKLVTRVLLEEQTKQRIADVVHTSVIETHILKKRGALSRYVPAESASYRSASSPSSLTLSRYRCPRIHPIRLRPSCSSSGC